MSRLEGSSSSKEPERPYRFETAHLLRVETNQALDELITAFHPETMGYAGEAPDPDECNRAMLGTIKNIQKATGNAGLYFAANDTYSIMLMNHPADRHYAEVSDPWTGQRQPVERLARVFIDYRPGKHESPYSPLADNRNIRPDRYPALSYELLLNGDRAWLDTVRREPVAHLYASRQAASVASIEEIVKLNEIITQL